MLNFDSINVLHPLQLSIQQLILVVSILELTQNGYIHLVNLSLLLSQQSSIVTA